MEAQYAVRMPSATEPSRSGGSGPVAAQLATPDPATPDPATPDPATPDPATPDPATADSTATDPTAAAAAAGSRDRLTGTGPPAVAWQPVLGVVLALGAVLVGLSERYGYHRDELYFITAGQHPQWGYPDQPALTPLILAAMDRLAPGSLVVLRLPGAVAAMTIVFLTALIAREMGGGRAAQSIAAGATAVSAFVLATGHFVTTTTTDLMFAAVLSWLAARLIRTRDPRLLLPAGLTLGVGLFNKDLIGFFAIALLAAIGLVGPREVVRGRWLVAGGAVAVLFGLPYLVWQARHGWPQVGMARIIAKNGDEGGAIGFIPFQFLLVSPAVAPVAGLRRLFRAPDARPFRAFGVGFLLLGGFFLVTGGKAYYLADAYPAVIAAGAITAAGWLPTGRRVRRRFAVWPAAFGVVIVLSAVISAFVGLPLAPAGRLAGSAALAVNPDAGEQVGWPKLVATVAGVWTALPADERSRAVIYADNYGEAGALELFGPARGLPRPYSGHNGFADWGTPPDSATTAVVIGPTDAAELSRYFTSCARRATIDNGYRLDNEEQGKPVWVCRGMPRAWSAIWPEIRHLG